MFSRRIAQAVAIPLALGLLGYFAEPGQAQAKKSKDVHGLDAETFKGIMSVVEEAAKNKEYRKERRFGGGTTAFEDAPSKPGIVVGLDVWPGVRGKTTQYVRGVRPLFLNNEGKRTQGTVHGWVGTGSVRIEAKPGYAVGGIKCHTDFGTLAGVQVVFFKITATGLDKDDSYVSKYYGHKDPDTAWLSGGTGEPVLGIHGMVADNSKSDDFGFGLIMLGDGKKKKK